MRDVQRALESSGFLGFRVTFPGTGDVSDTRVDLKALFQEPKA